MTIPSMTGAKQCPLCDSNEVVVAHRMELGNVMECRSCQFFFSDEGCVTNTPVRTPKRYIDGVLYSRDRRKFSRLAELAKNRHHVYRDVIGRDHYRMLEVGCGTAEIGEFFGGMGVAYFGIDVDANMIDYARTKKCPVECVDFMEFKSDAKFDVINFSQVLEHIPNPRDFIERASSFLSEGGIVHCDVPFHPDMRKVANRLVFTSKGRFGAITLPHHLYAYTASAMERLLSPYFSCQIFVAMPDDATWGNASFATMSRREQLILKAVGKLGVRRGFLVAVGRKRRTTGGPFDWSPVLRARTVRSAPGHR